MSNNSTPSSSIINSTFLGTPIAPSLEKRLTRSQARSSCNTPTLYQLNSKNEVISIQSDTGNDETDINDDSTLDALYKTALEGITDSSVIFSEDSPRDVQYVNNSEAQDTFDENKENTLPNKEKLTQQAQLAGMGQQRDFVNSSTETFVVRKNPTPQKVKISENTTPNITDPFTAQIEKNYKNIISSKDSEILKLKNAFNLFKEMNSTEVKNAEISELRKEKNLLDVQCNKYLSESNELKAVLNTTKLSVIDLQNENSHLKMAIQGLKKSLKVRDNAATAVITNPEFNIEGVDSDLFRKSVKFNRLDLTPEIIDSRMPAGTPVRRGRKPEQTTPGRSLLKSRLNPNQNLVTTKDSLFDQCEEASKAIQNLKRKFNERNSEVGLAPNGLEPGPEKTFSPEEIQQLKINESTPLLSGLSLANSTPDGTPVLAVSESISLLESMQHQLDKLKLSETPKKSQDGYLASLKVSHQSPQAQLDSDVDEKEKGKATEKDRTTPIKKWTTVDTKESLDVKAKLSDHISLSKQNEHLLEKRHQRQQKKVQPQSLKNKNSETKKQGAEMPSPEKTSTGEPSKSTTQTLESSSSKDGDSNSASKSYQKIKRISIANQNPDEKLLLEEKRKNFIKLREQKRVAQQTQPKQRNDSGNSTSKKANANDKNNTIKEGQETETNYRSGLYQVDSSPELFTNRKNILSELIEQETGNEKASEKVPDKQQIIQQRREKGKLQHEKQKHILSNTLNPRPTTGPASARSTTSINILDKQRPKSTSTDKQRIGPGRQNSGQLSTNASTKNVNHDNKQSIIQAIEKTCLPGAVNSSERKNIIEDIHKLKNDSEYHLMVLFRNDRFQFRGVYRLAKTDQSIILADGTASTETAEAVTLNTNTSLLQHFIKVSGKGPAKVSENDVKNYFTLNTGKKTFNIVNGKTFGFNVAGMTVDESFWSKSRPKRMEVRK